MYNALEDVLTIFFSFCFLLASKLRLFLTSHRSSAIFLTAFLLFFLGFSISIIIGYFYNIFKLNLFRSKSSSVYLRTKFSDSVILSFQKGQISLSYQNTNCVHSLTPVVQKFITYFFNFSKIPVFECNSIFFSIRCYISYKYLKNFCRVIKF